MYNEITYLKLNTYMSGQTLKILYVITKSNWGDALWKPSVFQRDYPAFLHGKTRVFPTPFHRTAGEHGVSANRRVRGNSAPCREQVTHERSDNGDISPLSLRSWVTCSRQGALLPRTRLLAETPCSPAVRWKGVGKTLVFPWRKAG
jgi:hypothetical protein